MALLEVTKNLPVAGKFASINEKNREEAKIIRRAEGKTQKAKR
jgi:hypothetical protein